MKFEICIDVEIEVHSYDRGRPAKGLDPSEPEDFEYEAIVKDSFGKNIELNDYLRDTILDKIHELQRDRFEDSQLEER